MKNAIVLYDTEHDLQIPTANEWKLMENVIRLLQPFEEYTKLLSLNNAPSQLSFLQLQSYSIF